MIRISVRAALPAHASAGPRPLDATAADQSHIVEVLDRLIRRLS